MTRSRVARWRSRRRRLGEDRGCGRGRGCRPAASASTGRGARGRRARTSSPRRLAPPLTPRRCHSRRPRDSRPASRAGARSSRRAAPTPGTRRSRRRAGGRRAGGPRGSRRRRRRPTRTLSSSLGFGHEPHRRQGRQRNERRHRLVVPRDRLGLDRRRGCPRRRRRRTWSRCSAPRASGPPAAGRAGSPRAAPATGWRRTRPRRSPSFEPRANASTLLSASLGSSHQKPAGSESTSHSAGSSW